MPAKRKSERTEVETQEVEETEETPNTGAFESHIKDGPSQDDLNPAYAPDEDDSEAAQAARKLADEGNAHGDDQKSAKKDDEEK